VGSVDFVKVFDEAPTPFLLLTPDFTIVHANRARLEVTATTLEQTVGRNLFEVFPMNPQDPAADGLRNLRDSLALTRHTKRPQTMAIQKYDIAAMPDGTWVERYWSPRNVPILNDDGEVVLLLHRADDISEYVSDRDGVGLDPVSGSQWHRRVHEVEADLFARTHELQVINRQLQLARDELAIRATHDPLTGLLARSALLEQLTHALARLPRHRGDIAVLFLDLDGLKQANDTHGHAAGDELIRCCAQRLRAAVRPSDTVARIGGDEFVVLLDELDEGHGGTAGHATARRIQDALGAPCAVAPNVHVRPSASIGIATAGTTSMASMASSTAAPKGAGSGTSDINATIRFAEELLSRADAAMYEAKRDGRGRFRTFDEATHHALAARQRLEAELRAALPTGQLRLHYQPIVDLRSGATYAVEALLRWQHPDGRLRAAGEFIDLLDHANLLPDIGAWVVESVCHQVAAWDAALAQHAPQRIFLNVSAAELTQPRLHQQLAAAAQTAGINPQRLVLEVTETGMLDTAHSADTLTALQHLGCQLAIDDFGTGYSSLSRLVQLPAHVLKIDQSFVRELHRDQQSVAVIAAVLTLAHNLRKTVIAEGVEDAASLHVLKDLGCDYAQGFHLGVPQPPDQLAARLTANSPPASQ
jgi:diguanylate cyclase (GGDEF)-like protein